MPEKTNCVFRLISYNGILYAGTSYAIWEWDGSSWSQTSEFNGNTTIGPTILGNKTLVSGMMISPEGVFYAGVEGAGVWAATIPHNATESTISEGPRSTIQTSGINPSRNYTIVVTPNVTRISPTSISGAENTSTTQAPLSPLVVFISISTVFVLFKKRI